MKRRYYLIPVIPLVFVTALAGGLARLRYVEDHEPTAVRLRIYNPFPAGMLVDAVEIAGRPHPLPGVQGDDRPRIEPDREWRGRFLIDPGGERPILVRLAVPEDGTTAEIHGVVIPDPGLACFVSVRSARDPARGLTPCFYDIDRDY